MKTAVHSIFLFLLAGTMCLQAQSLDSNFSQANAHYEAGNYAKALEMYRELAEDQLSSEVFYNLANTLFRQGQVGEACLYYRRALFMDPNMIEASQNLRLLRNKLGFLQFESTGMEQVVSRLPASGWTILTTTGVWVLILGIIALLVLKVRQPWNAVVLIATICGGIIGLLSLTGLLLHRANLDPADVAIVVSGDVSALSAPVPDAKSVLVLPVGSEVRIRKDRQKWYFIEAPGQSAGWVKADQVERLWPYSAMP